MPEVNLGKYILKMKENNNQPTATATTGGNGTVNV